MSLFVTTCCINVTHKVMIHTSELPMVKEQELVNLIPFPARGLYEYRGQQARPRLVLALSKVAETVHQVSSERAPHIQPIKNLLELFIQYQ